MRKKMPNTTFVDRIQCTFFLSLEMLVHEWCFVFLLLFFMVCVCVRETAPNFVLFCFCFERTRVRKFGGCEAWDCNDVRPVEPTVFKPSITNVDKNGTQCVCVRACVCVCACVHARVCVRVCERERGREKESVCARECAPVFVFTVHAMFALLWNCA